MNSTEELQGNLSGEQLRKAIPTAKLEIGNTPYIFLNTPTGRPILVALNTPDKMRQYEQIAARISEDHTIRLEDINGSKISFIDLDLSKAEIVMHQRMSKLKEPTFKFIGTDALNNFRQDFSLSEKEMIDLFLKPASDLTKSAYFFTADTAGNELMGIVLRRREPMIVLFRPERNSEFLHPKMGFASFLDGIYEAYLTELTNFQRQIDSEIFDQMGRKGTLNFPEGDGTLDQKLVIDILKKIYQIQGLFYAAQAEKKGTDLTDPDLLRHLPFLGIPKAASQPTSTEPRKTTITGMIKAFGNRKTGLTPQVQSIQTKYRIDFSIWENIATRNISEVFKNATPLSTATREQPVAIQPTAPEVPEPVSTRVLEVQIPQVLLPQRKETIEPEEQNINPKDVALTETRYVNRELEDSLMMFESTHPWVAGRVEIEELEEKTYKLIRLVQSFINKKVFPYASETSVSALVGAWDDVINVMGVKDQAVFGFLTGGEEVDWQEKIDQAFNVIYQDIFPIFDSAEARNERGFNFLRKMNAPARQTGARVDDILDSTESAFAHLNEDHLETLDLAVVAYLFLSTQIFFALSEQYSEAKRSENSSDLQFWAQEVVRTLTKLNAATEKVMTLL